MADLSPSARQEHPECVHYDGPPAHVHGTCCICDRTYPCPLVTDEQIADHDAFLASLFGEAS